jgi:8-oxo-dGTP diphosphatase
MKIRLAGCVMLDDYGRILLLHRSLPGTSQWELPGGKIEPGETAEQAAMREIDEELGVAVRLVKPLGVGGFEDEENEYEYVWFQAVVTAADPQLKETKKFDDLDYFDLEDLPSLALSANMQVLLAKIVSGEVSFIV